MPKAAAASIFFSSYYLGAISFCLWEAVRATKLCLRKKDKSVQKHLSKLLRQENLS